MGVVTRIATKAVKARIAAHMWVERMTDPHPRTLGGVPRSIGAITHDWLEQALCRDTPGAKIVHFDLGADDAGTTARQKISVTYNAAGQAAGLPERIFAKATPQFLSRYLLGVTGVLANEVNFYRRIQPMLDIETPVCHYCDYDRSSFRSVFLFEDAGTTKSATFLDPRYRPSRAEIEAMVVVLARLHSRFWNDPILDRDFTWIKDGLAYQLFANDVISFGEITALGQDRTVDVLPPALARRRGELWPALLRSCETRIRAPRTFLHGDVHIANWYVTGAGAMGLCDWQCTSKGSWAADFAYTVTSTLDIEDRRAWERDLLALYLGSLALPAGQRPPSFDAAWLEYRQQTLHGLYSWFFVAGIGAGETLLHADDLCRTNLARMAAAVDDLGTLDAFG